MPRTIVIALGVLVSLVAAASASAANPPDRRALVDPTASRLVEPRAATASSDGERFIVVTFATDMGRPVEVHDTFTGRRVRLPLGCSPVGSIDATTWLKDGRGLFACEQTAAVRLIDLKTGAAVADLPIVLDADGQRFEDPRYSVLGRRWIAGGVDCPGRVDCATVYYDYRTGETRLSRSQDGSGYQSARAYFDLDAPDLPLRRVCRPSIRFDGSVRHYRPPWFIDRDAGLRRCADGRLIVGFGRDEDVTSDLTATTVAWGAIFPNETKRHAYAKVYELKRRRLLRWRLPRIEQRRAAGTAITTRCEVYLLSSRTFGDRGGGPASLRIDRAELPEPRDRRCRR